MSVTYVKHKTISIKLHSELNEKLVQDRKLDAFPYATGAAIPMLAIAYGGQYATAHVRGIAPYAQRLQQCFGVLVIGFAVATYFQYDTLITVWLSDFYENGKIGL